jgi:hypothetical protein
MRTRGPFTIRTRDDLGSNGCTVFGEHLTLEEMRAWLDEHEDDGTFEIIDESDGLPACGDDTEMSGGAWACDCGRPHCSPFRDHETDVALPGDWHVRGPITVETESFIPPAEISAARIDQEHETMVEGGLRVTFSGVVTEGTMAGWWCVKGTSAPRADDEPVVVAQIPPAGRRQP